MYGLLGKKLSHSYSPFIHSLFADYEYLLFEKSEEELADFVSDGNVEGFNVTIPYKKTVMKYLDLIDRSAEAIGSVNTVVRLSDGRLKGYNTDYFGFMSLIKKSGISIVGAKALILGTGGASLAVSAVLKELGAGETVFISRSGENNYTNIERHFDADIIVNATPVGMYPDCESSPLSLEGFKGLRAVYDLIYNPARTRLLLEAEEKGIPAFSGLRMLVEQARRASEIFTDSEISDEESERALRTVELSMKNITLIGMPGCGKTTVGKILANRLSREFTDTDEEIIKSAGKDIPSIFSEEKEEGFRKRETKILKKFCYQSGRIIASGGGIVTVDKNYLILKQNCITVFINRSTDALPTDGRPLSQTVGKEELYRKRLPLYRKFCDIEIDGNGTPDEVADRITEALK